MEHEPNEGSPSSTSDSQNRAPRQPQDDSNEDLPSLEPSEASSHLETQPDIPEPGSETGSATSSRGLPSLEEDDFTDSENSDEQSPVSDNRTDFDGSDEEPQSVEDSTDSDSSDGDSLSEEEWADYDCEELSDTDESWTDSDSSSTSGSERSTDDSTPRQSRGNEEELADVITLPTIGILKGKFTNQTLDFRLPCTATEDTACQIVNHLSAWNEFFCLASWQLKKMPGTAAKLSLVFFRDSSWRYCSRPQLRLATLLVCELLKNHRCVSYIQLDVSLFNAHVEILRRALQASPSITSVKLVCCGWISAEGFATAVLSMPRLQELEFSDYAQHAPSLVSRLSTFLQTTTSLTALRVSKDCPKGLSCEEFFRGLGQNRTLRELALPNRLIAEAPPSAQTAFEDWLTNSLSLKSLTVTSDIRLYLPLDHILRAVMVSTSIVTVAFHCPDVDQSDVCLVTKIFENNKVLRTFKISYKFDHHSFTSSFVRGRPDKADCDRCLKALIENHTLEEVALPIDVWDDRQWKKLFKAVPAKRNLKRVSIEAVRRAPNFLVGKLCAALKETGAEEKVSFNASLSEKHFDERCACRAFSSIVASATDHNKAAIYGMLERLPPLGHITSLNVYFDIVNLVDGALSPVLATFLKTTCTLKSLTIGASWDMILYDCQEGLLDGLANNTSLREVQIGVAEARNDFSVFSKPLAEAVSSNKNISKVHLSIPDFGERAFYRKLSKGISDNYTLLSVSVLGYRYTKFKRYWFDVWDTTRRNCSLLIDAADFARGARRDGCCGLALERMHGHPQLVGEVARLEDVDQARAAAMVRDGLRSTEGLHDFMRLAGVVRERVSCHTREDGRTQLDALNVHCWRAVRSYLKLRDVKESMA